MSEVPRSLICHIATFCDISDLINIACTCKLWRDIPQDSFVCMSLYFRFFGSKTFGKTLSSWSARLQLAMKEQSKARTPREKLCWLISQGHSQGVLQLLQNIPTDKAKEELLNTQIAANGKDCIPLLEAVLVNSLDELDLLLRYGSKIDIRNNFGRTCLHIAAWEGQCEMMKALLERGANPLMTEWQYGQTAMHVAASKNNVNVMRILYNVCPELANKPDKDGWTPLSVASRRNSVDAINLLRSWI